MKTKTSLEALLERASATGYVVLESMATVLLETALAEAETPAPQTLATTSADRRFLARQRAIERTYATTGK